MHPKVAAAGGTASMAGAVTIILVYLIAQIWHVQIPDDVAQAITTIFAGAGAVAGGWFTQNPTQAPQGQKADA